MKWSTKIMVFLNIICVLATFGSYYADDVDPQNYWFFPFFGLMYPLLIICNLLFITYWLFVETKYSLISILTIAVGYKNIDSYFGFESGKVISDNYKISVVSYNIANALVSYDKDSEIKNSKLEKLNEFLSRFKDEDIICLQEVGSYAGDIIKKTFKDYHIHRFEKGTVIISKHKIIKKGHIEFGTRVNSCLWADLLIDLDTIRVYNLHLQSNKISKDADNVIANGQLKEEKTWRNLYGIFRKYHRHHKTRTHQAITVKEHADLSPHKIIMCGDFNDVPLSYNYNILQKNLVDAFKERGNGSGSTFNGKIPFLRIDYILVDNHFYVSKFNIIKENFSDHYPVATVLSFKKA